MKKTIRKNTQLSLINLKSAGRKAFHDPGIRHTARPVLTKPSSLHLTIKVQKIKADIKNKMILTMLKKAILNARRMGLKVIHYSLEYDHVHLLIEADNNVILGKGMQSLGVTLSKAINRTKRIKGRVYKHRYHFRKINSARELKNVMFYIFNNGVKHGASKSLNTIYNSFSAEIKFPLFTKERIQLNKELLSILDRGKIFFKALEFV